MTATALPFDFSTPRHIAPDGQIALREWQEVLCAAATDSCRSLTAGTLEWKVAGIEIFKTQSALATLTDDHLVYEVKMDGEAVTTLWHWDQSASLGLVASLLGADEAAKDRHLTSVEQSLLEMVLDCWIKALDSTWPSSRSVDAHFTRVTNPRFAKRMMERVDDVVGIQYTQVTELGELAAHWLVPKSFVEDHLADLSANDTSDRTGELTSAEIVDSDIPVAISVELGRKTVPLSHIRSIQEHDVIILDQSIHEPLKMLVEGRFKMTGLPGRSGSRQVMRIVEMDD